MFAELDQIALTTAIPLESIFDVPSQSPIWDSPNGEGLIPGDVGKWSTCRAAASGCAWSSWNGAAGPRPWRTCRRPARAPPPSGI